MKYRLCFFVSEFPFYKTEISLKLSLNRYEPSNKNILFISVFRVNKFKTLIVT